MAKRKNAPRSKTTQKGSTRQKILSLLSRERKKYNRKLQEFERVAPTMAQIAREVGVSIRTLRRWKNEGVEPRNAASAKKLVRVASRAQGQTARELTLDKRRHPRAVRFTRKDMPVLPAGHRRQLRRYGRKKGRVVDTGKTYESSWINYAVHGWNFRELGALVAKIWRSKHPFQFIYDVPAGGSLPKSGDKPARRVRRTTRAATAPINPYAFRSEADLMDFLNNYIDYEQGKLSRRMVYVAVDDNRPEPADDVDEGEE